MQLRRSLHVTLGLGLALIMSACVPYSRVPLSDPQASAIDAALIGSWRGGDPGDRVYVHIGAADNHRVRILTVEHERSGRLEVVEYLAHSSHSNGHDYLNVVEQGRAARPGYILVRYRVDQNGDLRIAMPNEAGIEAAIRNGGLSGYVEKSDLGDAVITAPAAETAAYLNAHQAALFEKEVALQRLD